MTLTRRLAALAFIALPILAGCQGGSLTSSSQDPAIAISIRPDPFVGVPAPAGSQFSLLVSFTVEVKELAGVQTEVRFVNVTVRMVNGNGADSILTPEVGTVTFGAEEIIRRAGTNRIAAYGRLRIPLAVVYTLPFGQRRGSFVIAVQASGPDGSIANAVHTVEGY